MCNYHPDYHVNNSLANNLDDHDTLGDTERIANINNISTCGYGHYSYHSTDLHKCFSKHGNAF